MSIQQNIPQRIFTFWEPADKMPAYIRLCINSWKKFLPGYEIIILNYSNLNQWLSNYYDDILYKEFSLSKQADAIRCAVLRQYGGIWLDADTIILSDEVEKIFNPSAEFSIINVHLAFIAAKPNAKVLKLWERGIKTRLNLYKKFKTSFIYYLMRLIKTPFAKRMISWNFLGNSITDKILKKRNNTELQVIKAAELKVFPEILWQKLNGTKLRKDELYRKFYFEQNNYDFVKAQKPILILLHNSWTPEIYRQLNEEEFLRENNTISNILKEFQKMSL